MTGISVLRDYRRRRGQLTRLHTAAALAQAARDAHPDGAVVADDAAALLRTVIGDSTAAELGLWARRDALARTFTDVPPSPPRYLLVPAVITGAAAAITAYWLAPAGPLLTAVSVLDAIATGLLAWQFVQYADVRRPS
jgi:hypothetical protein